jgi:hypothetical protein
MKRAGSRARSGTVSQRYGSADLDPDQNVEDPLHWLQMRVVIKELFEINKPFDQQTF